MAEENKSMIKKLNGENYFNWRYKMQMMFKGKGLWKVIKDDAPEPLNDDWTEKDEKAHSKIALNIEDNQIQHIRTCKSAKEAWEKLKDFHEKDTPNSRVAILKKLMTKKLEENEDAVAHVNEMNELFQKLLALGDEFKPEFILSATLIGSLPESYSALAAILESRNEELTSSLVCSKIIDEYERRKERNVIKENAAYKLSSNSSRYSKDGIVCFFCDKKGHYKQNCEEYKEWNEKKQSRSEKVRLIYDDESFVDYAF